MFDVLITVAEKDFNKLKYCIESIKRNVCGFDKIHVVSPTPAPWFPEIVYHLDNEVINIDLSGLKGNNAKRVGWYKQQFIKLFQKVTSNDYLVVDADCYFNRPVRVVEDGKPIFLLGKNQEHCPYFKTMQKLFGVGRVFPHSFINEVMYFKRDIVEFLFEVVTVEEMVAVLNEVNDASGFSEYETYGNLVMHYDPKLYDFKVVKTADIAHHRVWDEKEVKHTICIYAGTNYDIIKMHSWL